MGQASATAAGEWMPIVSTVPITTLIFDLDDTLYDHSTGMSALHWPNLFAFMSERLGYESNAAAIAASEEYYESLPEGSCHSDLHGLQQLQAMGKLPNGAKSQPEELGQFYVDRIPFETLLSPADKAFRDFLARCLGPIKLVLFTNSPRTYAKRALQALKLDSFFPHGRFFSVEDVLPLCKPQEDAFAKVLEAVGSSPYETVLFEDSMLNIRAAKAMGIRTVLVRGRRRQRADAPASSFDPSVSKAFQMIDINGNGAIGRQEVTMALEGSPTVRDLLEKSCGCDLSQEAFRGLFTRFDRNPDQMKQHEFQSIFAGPRSAARGPQGPDENDPAVDAVLVDLQAELPTLFDRRGFELLHFPDGTVNGQKCKQRERVMHTPPPGDLPLANASWFGSSFAKWYGEWFMELDWWWVEIPKSVRNDVSLCFSALSLHLANRLRFLSPRGGSAMSSPPPPVSGTNSEACEWVRSKEGVEEHLPGLPDFPELPSEFRLPFPLPALPLLRPEWDSYVRSIRKDLPMAETTPTNGHSSTAVESAASGRVDSFGRSLTNSTGGGALAGVLLGLVFVWIRSRRVRTRIRMGTGHDDVTRVGLGRSMHPSRTMNIT